MRASLVCVLAFVAIGAFAQGQTPQVVITDVKIPQKGGNYTQVVDVLFKSPVPESFDLRDTSKWVVVVSYAGKASIATFSDPMLKVSQVSKQFVYLTLPDGTLNSSLRSVGVYFEGATPYLWTATPTPTSMPPRFSKASGKGSSNIYLNASYSPAIQSTPQYSIDGQVRLAEPIGSSPFRVGGLFTVSTDNRRTVDPDSYFASGLVEWSALGKHFLFKRAEGVLVDWDFAGLEFDRSTTTNTFISSPVAEVPLRLYPRPGVSSTRFSLSMFPYAGFEIGNNLSNALNSSGSGFVFRGLVGAAITFKAKTGWEYFTEITATSNYTGRIPTTDEIFTDTHFISATEKSVSLPILSRQMRHHLLDEIDVTVSGPFAITIKHEYGELPPGFRKIDNKVSVGVTVMLQQKGTPPIPDFIH